MTKNDRAESARDTLRDVQDELRAALANGIYATMDDAQTAMHRVTEAYNARPQAELNGLSPNQAFALFHADWMPGSAIDLDETTPLAELDGATLLHDARALMRLVGDGVKATATGNLSRATVAAFLADLPVRGGNTELEAITTYGMALRNELDVWPLHHARVVLQLAGFLARRKGVFHVTKRGAMLARDGHAGELWTHLLRAQFKKMNLAYLDRMGPAPVVQHAVGFALYQFSRADATWRRAEEWLERLLPSTMRDELPTHALWDPGPLLIERRVLYPLRVFGLAEYEERPAPPGQYGPQRFYRPSRLLTERVRFRV
ncbi:MAG: hypothetical protein MUF00_00480 [Gemmatimonadaceae bacterium]|jgi:hypothetical protein|nr:hypothetical protein [Gemmatimonadaceae bacterium]